MDAYGTETLRPSVKILINNLMCTDPWTLTVFSFVLTNNRDGEGWDKNSPFLFDSLQLIHH